MPHRVRGFLDRRRRQEVGWARHEESSQLLAVVVLLSFSCSRGRPVGPGDVAARKAMVASAHPAATAVGVEILKQGGNAVDAAVAVAFALSMAEPNASGVGGGGFMVVRMAGAAPVMIDYRETAPAGATPERYYAPGVDFAARTAEGPDAVGVPGLVAGAALALEKYGTMSLAEVLAPTVRLAREGITVSPKLNGMIVDEIGEDRQVPGRGGDLSPGRPAARSGKRPQERRPGGDAGADRGRRRAGVLRGARRGGHRRGDEPARRRPRRRGPADLQSQARGSP